MNYLTDAYRVRVAVNKERNEIQIYTINKDYALSGELNEASLLPVSISKTYARICSRPLIEYLSKAFNLSIEKKNLKGIQHVIIKRKR